jgi:hypothetical protein
MKNNILKYSLITFAIVSSTMAFSQEDKASAKARKNEVKAQNKINLAKKDSAADFEKFKTQSEAKIKDNQKQIEILKNKKLMGTVEANKKYDKDVLKLEQRNNELATRIDLADDIPTSGWKKFKQDFNDSMADLGCALRNVGTCEK